MRPSGVHCVAMPVQFEGEHCPPEQLWPSPQCPSGIQALPSALHCSTDLLGPQRSTPGGQLALSGQVAGSVQSLAPPALDGPHPKINAAAKTS